MKIFSKRIKTPWLKKKGSLQLSINAIVILILAITLLGLGLGFIKGIFKGTLGKLTKIEEQLGEEERKALLDSTSEITFLTSRVKVTGRETDLNFAIRNNRPETLKFDIKDRFDCYDALGDLAAEKIRQSTPEDPLIDFETYRTVEVEGSKSAVIPLKIRVAPDADPTIYSCKLDVKALGYIDQDGNYVEYDPVQQYKTKRFEIEYNK